ncbi:MAG: SH3 domain-containing protein [Vicinamibacterales bacterium]
MRQLIAIASLMWLTASGLVAVPQAQAVTPATPCVRDGQAPTLRPTDGATTRLDFLEFRRRLQAVVAARDEAGLVSALDPAVRVDFGGGGGVDDFRRAHLGAAAGEFWAEFGRILASGGNFIEPGVFAAPYVYASWPEDLDAFECLAVTGTSVRLREAPGRGASVIGALDYAIVQTVNDSRPDVAGWRRVRTAKGRTGYVAEQYLRSPIDHRALFGVSDRRWRLTAYLAGD